MWLEPADKELTWADVERNFASAPTDALKIWRDCGILMPDDAADNLAADLMDTFLTATAEALQIPLRDIYPKRHQIQWMTWTDTPGAWATFCRINGGQPTRLNHPNQTKSCTNSCTG